MRRYVPVVLPLTMLFGARTVVTLLARVAAATYRRGLTLATGALLVGLVARPSVAVVGQPLWDDALAQTAQVARLFPDQAVVLVSPDLAGTHIPTSLAYLHDADAILVQERNPDDQVVMRRVIRAWLARGRAVFIVVGLRDFSFFASDLALEAVGSAHLNLRTLERTRTRVPQAVVLTPIQLQLFRVTRTVGPDRTAIDVGTPRRRPLVRPARLPCARARSGSGQRHVPVDRAARIPHAAGGARRHAGRRGRPAARHAPIWPRRLPKTTANTGFCPALSRIPRLLVARRRRDEADTRVAELLRKAIEWRALLTAGEVAAQAAIARREGITRAA